MRSHPPRTFQDHRDIEKGQEEPEDELQLRNEVDETQFHIVAQLDLDNLAGETFTHRLDIRIYTGSKAEQLAASRFAGTIRAGGAGPG